MRILLLSDVYFPRVNGVSTSIRTFRMDLARLGVESVLVAPRYPARTGSDEEGVVRVDSWSVPRDPEDRFMPWRALQRALRPLREQRFDLVHVHTPFVAHYAGVRFARAARIPVMATYHTLFAEYLHHYLPLLPRRAGQWFAQHFTRSQCAQLDAVVAPSQPMAELLVEYGVTTPIQVVPTGLAADRYPPGDRQRFRARHLIPSQSPLLLFVGRVAHEKNIDFLLHAFAEVLRHRPDALLVIAGEGPAQVHLAGKSARLGLGRSVVFIGYLERQQELLDCYAAADLFVFASRTETQGLVLLEAMAQGCPVVSTACLGTRSILQPGSGSRVAPEDAVEFARHALTLLADPARRAQAGNEARRYALGWASTIMAQRMSDLYRQVVASPGVAHCGPTEDMARKWS